MEIGPFLDINNLPLDAFLAPSLGNLSAMAELVLLGQGFGSKVARQTST